MGIKSESLSNFIKYKKWMDETLDYAKKHFYQELKAVLTDSMIERILVDTHPNYINHVVYIELNKKFKEFIKAIMESDGIKINPENLGLIPFAIIDLDTEVMTVYDLTEVRKFIEKIFSEIFDEWSEAKDERYKLNIEKETKSFLYKFIHKTDKKLSLINNYIKVNEEILDIIKNEKSLFFERNVQGIVKTFKEEFEAAFGIKLVVKGEQK